MVVGGMTQYIIKKIERQVCSFLWVNNQVPAIHKETYTGAGTICLKSKHRAVTIGERQRPWQGGLPLLVTKAGVIVPAQPAPIQGLNATDAYHLTNATQE